VAGKSVAAAGRAGYGPCVGSTEEATMDRDYDAEASF